MKENKRKIKSGKTVLCFQCNTPVYITPSRIRKNKIHHCSVRCMALTNKERYSRKVEVPCSFCKKPIFYKLSKIKEIAYPTCSNECKNKIRSITFSKDSNPKSLKLNELDRFFWTRAKEYQRRAKCKNIPFDLDYIFLKELFQNQQGLCYYSDVPMKFESAMGRKNRAATFDVASLDRKDSNLGYIKDNVVWALNCINMLKAHHDLKDIRKVMRAIMMKEKHRVNVKVKLLYGDSKMPTSASDQNTGYDLFTHRVEDCGSYVKIYSGIAISPEPTHYFLLAPRSSVYKKGLIMHNSVGVIDTNYRGEIIGIFNKTDKYVEVVPGERVMQLVAQELIPCEFEEVESLNETNRGSGGFGSTGR